MTREDFKKRTMPLSDVPRHPADVVMETSITEDQLFDACENYFTWLIDIASPPEEELSGVIFYTWWKNKKNKKQLEPIALFDV